MGCDIHMYAEIKFDDTWSEFKIVNLRGYDIDSIYYGRSYEVFGFLSDGVRGYKNGLPPRGLPCDVSKIIKSKFDGWGNDAHSASWMTFTELRVAIKEMMARKIITRCSEIQNIYKSLRLVLKLLTLYKKDKKKALLDIKSPIKGLYAKLAIKNYFKKVNGLRIIYWFDS